MKFKNFILGVGIFVVFALALNQGLETFYPTPQYEDYCDIDNRAYPIAYKDTSTCPNNPDLNRRAEQCTYSKGDFVYTYDLNGCPIDGTCDPCRLDYEADLDVHSSRVFIIAIIVGIIVFVTGFFLLSTEPVGSALMASGIWSVFFGVVKNWRNFTQAWRFLLLFVLLVVLIWLALRFNKKDGFFSKLKKKIKN